MDIVQFVQKNYIDILWNHQGYNPINTLTYAIVAIVALYSIFLLFKKYNVKIDKNFVLGALPFIMLGSTLRVLTDSLDGHFRTSVMQVYVETNSNIIVPIYEAIINSHIYDYGYLTVTPGVYVVIAIIFLISLTVCHYHKKMKYLPFIGIALWLPHFLIILPMVRYPLYGIGSILLAGLAVLVAYFIFKKLKIKDMTYLFIVGGHSLDGATTFFTIDLFNSIEPACLVQGMCYGEQHVVASILGEYSYFFFFLTKLAISIVIAYYLARENEKNEGKNSISSTEKYFLILILSAIGFGPGIRNAIRIMIGA